MTDPELKRTTIGEQFIRVFRAKRGNSVRWTFWRRARYTPTSSKAQTNVRAIRLPRIKTHHNVGGLPKDMALQLIEPLRFLFKDEVRAVGKALGLPDQIVWRPSFPEAGLAVRVIGAITRERLDTLREVDAILIEELWASDWYPTNLASLAVLLPVQSVGVIGDGRTYANVAAIRAVTTEAI